ncbi:MAG: type II toxin-antitoxin system HicA family toxin [Elusimicrobiota bacterium]
MPRLGSVKPREFVRKLKKAGFAVDHQTGSHLVLYHPSGVRLIVPMHAREMKRGLLVALLKQAGLSIEGFQML